MSKISKSIYGMTILLGLSLSSVVVAAPQEYQVGQPNMRGTYISPNNIKLEGQTIFDAGSQKVTISLRNTDVQQVLRMFADKAGMNIIFHSSATGTVTMDLVDVSLNEAFNLVLKMTNLTYFVNDGTLMIVSTAESNKVNLGKDNISILPVKYADAAYIANFLNTSIFSLNTPGLSYGPIVVTNPTKNELMIFGTENDYRMAKKIVDKLDKKPNMTTYKVNHTSPDEMSALICETLFALPKTTSSSRVGQGGSGSSQMSIEYNAMKQASRSNKSLESVELGGGTVMCSLKSSITTDSVSSFAVKPSIQVISQQSLGTITLVGGSEQQIQMVNDFILANDRKQPQAYLEVSILELSETGAKEFYNNWQLQSKFVNIGFNSSTDSGTTSTSPIIWSGNRSNTPFSLTQTITYIITSGKGRMLANPKIVITNGKKSTIDLTSDYVKTVTGQFLQTTSGGLGAATSQKTYEIGNDNGIKVEVMPFISPDGYVSLSMKPNYSTISEYIRDPSTNDITATLLRRNNLELSNVRIKDEETLLIGGMIQETDTNKVSKVPILGDIPVIGTFFRGQSHKLEKKELVIMITPRIIKDTEDVVGL